MRQVEKAVSIDGAYGEGGGQILRSALTLSLITKRPVRVERIRARRSKPGLRAQHLAAVRAAAMIAPGTRAEGAELGSSTLWFEPAAIRPGRFNIEIGTAGNVGLVLQTIALPLCLAGGRSLVRISGGTHVPWSPSYEFLNHVWVPSVRQMDMLVELSLDHAGFYPRGNGQIRATIRPLDHPPVAISRCRRPRVIRLQVFSHQTSDLGAGKDRRQSDGFVARVGNKRRLIGELLDIERREGRFEFRGSTGTAFCAVVETDSGPVGFQQLGSRRQRAEQVGQAAADELVAFLESGAAVDRHLADQLLLPMALADGVSEITTTELTRHLSTLIHVVEQFLDARFEVTEKEVPVRIVVRP